MLLATALALLLPLGARAEWEVRRTGNRALVERAETELRSRPDDDRVARRLVQLAGPGGRAALRARFQSRAEGATEYGPIAAYAQVLLALGQGKEAAAAFSEALRLSPRAKAALAGRARALVVAEAWTESAAAYDEAVRAEERPGPRRRLLEAQLAVLARSSESADDKRRQETLERTVTARRELLRIDPDRDGAAERLADALEQAGRPVEAAEALEERLVTTKGPEKVHLALRAGRLRLAGSAPADAERAAAIAGELLRRLPAGDDRRREGWGLAVKAARRRALLPEVAAELARAVERSAGVVEWDVLGQVRDELGDLEGALEATRAALTRAPGDAEIGRRLIALLERLGREEDATEAAEELARRHPTQPRFAIELIDRKLRRGERAEGGAALDRALARFGRDRTALLELAALASRWGEEGRAHAIWQRLYKLDPRDEVAIIGLGEALFQRGRKDDARRTWALLRDRARSPAGHLRLAEVLLEHDLAGEAAAEARRAQVMDPKSVAPHRVLAQIFERQKRFEDAIAEWNLVLALTAPKVGGNAGPPRGEPASPEEAHAGLRREARVRVLALLARQGRAHLDAQIRKLREEARDRRNDLEAIMFLAEAQQRAGDNAGAIATLRELVGRSGPGGGSEASVDAAFALVHLLKRNGELDEAAARLAEIARIAPQRARDAHLQMAELALGRYATAKALSHAEAAAADADAPALARVADLQSRAGADDLAIATYRKALARDASPAAALALVRLLERRGDPEGAVATLDLVLHQSRDEEAVVEAGRLAIDLHEFLGKLPALEERLAEAFAGGQETGARRRTLVAVLRRLLPALYRDPAADAIRLRLGRQALRALLEVVTDAEQTPDRATIELLGMLGNVDAAPALARIATRPTDSPAIRRSARPVVSAVSADAQLAAVIALGRLADPRGRAAIERHLGARDAQLRTAAVWALGRLPDAHVIPSLAKALDDRHADVAVAACLGLALRRPGGGPALDLLVRAARDPGRPLAVRRAAAGSLGRLGRAEAIPALFNLLDAGDEDLSMAAATALVWSRDPRVPGRLLVRALLPRRFALAGADVPLAALASWVAGAVPADDGRLYGPGRLDLDAMFPPPLGALPPELKTLWQVHAKELQEALGQALSAGREARLEALLALDAHPDRIALGALSEDEESSKAAESAQALRELVLPLADRLFALLDDPEADVRATALRVLVKLGDERVLTGPRIATAINDDSVAVTAAGTMAAARVARERPALIPNVAASIAPALGDESWRRRLAAVETLNALGPSTAAVLERARGDRNAIVRAAARAAPWRTISAPASP